MKRCAQYIAGFIITTVIMAAALFAATGFAEHVDDPHVANYFGAPGDVLHGQVAIMNPTNEVKIVQATIEKSHTEHEQWLFLDNDTYTLSPNSKTVITYKVVIPENAKNDCEHFVKIREISPSNSLSLTHTASVSVIKSAANGSGVQEVNIFYTLFFIMLVVAFGLGIAICIVLCMKYIPKAWNGKKARKRRK